MEWKCLEKIKEIIRDEEGERIIGEVIFEVILTLEEKKFLDERKIRFDLFDIFWHPEYPLYKYTVPEYLKDKVVLKRVLYDPPKSKVQSIEKSILEIEKLLDTSFKKEEKGGKR